MSYLDEKKRRATAFCRRRSFIGHRSESGVTKIVHGHLRCKSYYCPHCAKRNAKILVARILSMELGPSWRHVVLTWDPKKGDKRQAVKGFPLAWSRLRKRIKRRYPHFKAIWVLEFTEKGFPHYHLLVNTPLPKKWLDHAADDCGLGRITWVDRVTGQGCAYYLVKYVTKFAAYCDDILEIIAEFRPRKYQFSQEMEPFRYKDRFGLDNVMMCYGDTSPLINYYISKHLFGTDGLFEVEEVVNPWTTNSE